MTEHYTVNRRILLTTAVFMFTLILACGGMGVYILSDPGLRDSMYMARVAVEVRNTYPEALDWERMFDAAMEAKIVSELSFQPFGFHIGTIGLYRVYDLVSGFYEVWHQFIDRTA